MSDALAYISEPAVNGKVVIVTSFGDLDVELWSKEAPKACRNFIQLALEVGFSQIAIVPKMGDALRPNMLCVQILPTVLLYLLGLLQRMRFPSLGQGHARSNGRPHRHWRG